MRTIREIRIEFIPHSKQRFPTVGDWIFECDILRIRVSEFGNWRQRLAVAIHEAIEAMLCEEAGIDEKDVLAFDVAYEARRTHGDVSEPGDSPDAPYRPQHRIATTIEREAIEGLGMDWNEYESLVNAL